MTGIIGQGPQAGIERWLTRLLSLPLGEVADKELSLSWLVLLYVSPTYRCNTAAGGRKGSRMPLSSCVSQVCLNSNRGIPVRRGRMWRVHFKILSHSMATLSARSGQIKRPVLKLHNITDSTWSPLDSTSILASHYSPIPYLITGNFSLFSGASLVCHILAWNDRHSTLSLTHFLGPLTFS